VRTHPQAVAILRKRDRPAAPARSTAAQRTRPAATTTARPVSVEDDQSLSRWWAAVAVGALLATTLAFLLAVGASVREARRARRRAA
jgi:hypothetical protein